MNLQIDDNIRVESQCSDELKLLINAFPCLNSRWEAVQYIACIKSTIRLQIILRCLTLLRHINFHYVAAKFNIPVGDPLSMPMSMMEHDGDSQPCFFSFYLYFIFHSSEFSFCIIGRVIWGNIQFEYGSIGPTAGRANTKSTTEYFPILPDFKEMFHHNYDSAEKITLLFSGKLLPENLNLTHKYLL